MNDQMTKEIRKNTSSEVRLGIKREMREFERELDLISEPVNEQVKDEYQRK